MRFLSLILGISISAGASVIVPPGTFSNVSGNSTVNTTIQGNNNHPGGNSPNTITINEVAGAVEVAMGVSFDVLADVGGPGGSTEYAVTKTVINNTGQTWTTFAMALNYLFISGPINAANLIVVQLDADSLPTLTGSGTSGQSLLSSTFNQAVWSGLNVQNGDSITLNFSVDTCPSCNGVWQLLQVASNEGSTAEMPEPGMFALVGLGLISIALRNKFRT